MNIWVCEHTGYPDECYTVGYYASEEAAVRGLKALYGPPYRVTWEETRSEDGTLELTGEFKWVRNYSTEHTAYYAISKCEVQA